MTLLRRAVSILPGALFALSLASQGSATVPSGYFIDPKQAVADRPMDRVEDEGDFTLAIHRRYEGPTELKLLSIAEAIYPPREILIARAIERNQEMGSDSARVQRSVFRSGPRCSLRASITAATAKNTAPNTHGRRN